MSIDNIIKTVLGFGCREVTLTGGEPLAQKHCLNLLTRLCDSGNHVSLETSGALPIDAVDPRVVRVLDIKTPGSGEMASNRWSNLAFIRNRDVIKFVVCDRMDFDWCCKLIQQHQLAQRCSIYFSPSANELQARELAEWILADHVPVRLQLQVHKFLWGNEAGH